MGCSQIKKKKMLKEKQYFNQLEELQNIQHQIYFIMEINLSWRQINEESILCLCIYLQKCANLQNLTLILFHNYIGDQGILDLSIALSKCVNLTTLKLDLISNLFFDDGIINFANEILKYPKLKILILYINNNMINRKLKLRNKIKKAKRLVKFSIFQ
ncbi:hypothetical protein ABPG72_016672 [Tetrahymena utriculariae]